MADLTQWVDSVGGSQNHKILGKSPQQRSQLGPKEELISRPIESQKALGDRGRMELSPGFSSNNGKLCHSPPSYRLFLPVLLCLWTSPFPSAATRLMVLTSGRFHGMRRQTPCRPGISFLASAAKNVQSRSLLKSENLLSHVPQSNEVFFLSP